MMTSASFSCGCRCLRYAHLMKINKHTPLLALLFASGTLQAQTILDGSSPAAGPPYTIPGNTTVNGTLTVQPTVLVTPGTPTVTPGPGSSTNLGGVVAGTGGDVIVTQTLIDTTNNSQVVTGGGGATIQTNGDTQLSAPSATTSTVDYGRAVRFEVAQAGNTNPVGLAIPGTEVYYLTNAAGVQVAGAPTFTSEALLDAYIATLTPATMLVLDPTLGTQVTAAGAGGNLTVDGATTTNGINNSGEKITNVAAGVAPTDAANVGQVDAAVLAETNSRIADVNAEEAARIAADTSIRTDFAAADTVERNARILADNSLGARIDSEVSDRIAGDAALGIRINDEQSARIAADNALGIRVDNEQSARIAADNALGSRVTNETNDRIAADNVLGARIDENTRGIAMVAAMTNTRVEAGKTHGVDFNMAQFQSETGFAFGYANRVNENVQLQTSVASTTDFDESVVRVGVAVQW